MKDKTSAASEPTNDGTAGAKQSVFAITPSHKQTAEWKSETFGEPSMTDEQYQKELFRKVTGIKIAVLGHNPEPRTRINMKSFAIDVCQVDEEHTMYLDSTQNGIYFNFKFICLNKPTESSMRRTVPTGQFKRMLAIRELIHAQVCVNVKNIINEEPPIMFCNILDGDLCYRYINEITTDTSFVSPLFARNVDPILDASLKKTDPEARGMIRKNLWETIRRYIFIGDMMEFVKCWPEINAMVEQNRSRS